MTLCAGAIAPLLALSRRANAQKNDIPKNVLARADEAIE
jgi:hypothetical protein